MLHKILRLPKVLRKKDFFIRRDIKLLTLTFGSKNSAWTVRKDSINERSIIYSFGVGNDISFDLALIERFGSTIHAFDPTPKSIQWVKDQKLPEKFIFHEIGLAAYNGTANFILPKNPAHVSATILKTPDSNEFFIADVKRLKSIMCELSHCQIDILKMDIEGAEYNVIDDIIASDVIIKQILIEFHHRFRGVGISKTKDAVKKLRKSGYFVFHVSESGEEVSFINNQLC